MPASSDKNSAPEPATTGHSWDGIEEYNKPLPKWWLYVLYATIVWSIGYYIFYPSWPWANGYLRGVLGYNQRVELEQTMVIAREAQGALLAGVGAAELPEIEADPDLRAFAVAGGKTAFADNCAPCHGPGGGGQVGYPSLADDEWIWGGTLEDIHQTLLYGVRFGHDESRLSEMPAFGAMLERGQINAVAEYVLSLSGQDHDAAVVEEGAEIFGDNCAACHGEKGDGVRELGAPSLADSIWLYGSDKNSIVRQITQPRHGVMPAWIDRLDPVTIKMLTVYVHSLGGGE